MDDMMDFRPAQPSLFSLLLTEFTASQRFDPN
jgi:hypothetical protein